MPRNPTRQFGLTVATVLALAALYVVAYFSIVETTILGPEEMVHNAAKSRTYILTTEYRFGGAWAEWLFRPVRTLDRGMRFSDGRLDQDGFVEFYSESMIEQKD